MYFNYYTLLIAFCYLKAEIIALISLSDVVTVYLSL